MQISIPRVIFSTIATAALAFPTALPAHAAACAVTQTTETINGSNYQVASISNAGSCEFTVPTGVESIDALIVAGGGGGGGGAGYAAGASGGGGGGAGGFGIYSGIAVTPGGTLDLTVGSGGSLGAGGGTTSTPGANGGNGGASSLAIAGGLTYTENGGQGGSGGSAVGGTGGTSGDGFAGGSPSGLQGGSGGSSTAAGSAVRTANVGSLSDFAGANQTYSYGGGGGNQGQYGLSAGLPVGGGGWGGRGPQYSIETFNTTYVYAYNGQGGAAGIIVLRWLTPAAPDAPTSVQASQSGGDSALLSWSAPSSTGNSSILGYKVEVLNQGAWSVKIANTGNAQTSATITGLMKGERYTFRVEAINAIGNSTPSSESSVIEIFDFQGGEVVFPAVPFRGPMIVDASGQHMIKGESLKLELHGKRLSRVLSASINGQEMSITYVGSDGRKLLIQGSPELATGSYDLVLQTSHGPLVVVGLVKLLHLQVH